MSDTASVAAILKGMQAHYLGYITGTSKEAALLAVSVVWNRHSTEIPTADGAFDLIQEAAVELVEAEKGGMSA